MGFFKNIKSAFVKENKEEVTEEMLITTEIINEVENLPFAISNHNVLYAGLSELAGYHYFQVVNIGTLKIKTHKGAQLHINGKDFELNLNSDMLELESESTPVSNRHLTKFDFEIEKDDIPLISKSNIRSLSLKVKKETIEFSIAELSEENDEEE